MHSPCLCIIPVSYLAGKAALAAFVVTTCLHFINEDLAVGRSYQPDPKEKRAILPRGVAHPAPPVSLSSYLA